MTRLLTRLADGHAEAADELWSIVYGELRRLAGAYLVNEHEADRLEPTGLVNEAFIRLCSDQVPEWRNRAQFFSVAARAMRRILTDHARRRRAAKRGGGRRPLPLDDSAGPLIHRHEDIVALDESLSRLAEQDPHLAQVVELHFFGGRTFEDAASLLNMSPATAKRMWKMAKGWLYRDMTEEH